jgi:hypothetical protein
MISWPRWVSRSDRYMVDSMNVVISLTLQQSFLAKISSPNMWSSSLVAEPMAKCPYYVRTGWYSVPLWIQAVLHPHHKPITVLDVVYVRLVFKCQSWTTAKYWLPLAATHQLHSDTLPCSPAPIPLPNTLSTLVLLSQTTSPSPLLLKYKIRC